MSSIDVHFGLGNLSDSGYLNVRIEWPSGVTTLLQDLELDQLHEIAEPTG